MSETDVVEKSIGSLDNTLKYAPVNINKPRWDQSTFFGRLSHFAAITDAKKALATNAKLDEAKEIVLLCRY